ncbi:hypothetical protein GO001_32295 [Streptomyces sp. NRRL B-1677]|uniref:hypothetical protein n=1 Tax=Streptomyces sp. NRRL B-1677 TaxID=2682966 RepID=UPI001892A23A|nr:hypothetical protein [Streptomyces sp. NRRL B-1677]MBF6049811.1 hypothetical protein [Streptomyces sp. NRRL B-1677]
MLLRTAGRITEAHSVLEVPVESLRSLTCMGVFGRRGVRLRIAEEALHQLPGMPPGAGYSADLLRITAVPAAAARAVRSVSLTPSPPEH